MGDVGDTFKAFREHKKEMRAKYGVGCPDCIKYLPKTNPTILLPQQQCRIHGYRDPRPRIKE